MVGTAATTITRTADADGESALGDLIADAQRDYAGAQIAFMNPGGIRADIQAGEVTYGELFTVQPFDNQVVKMELTGTRSTASSNSSSGLTAAAASSRSAASRSPTTPPTRWGRGSRAQHSPTAP